MPRLNLKNICRLMSDTIAFRSDTHTVEVRSLIDHTRTWRFSTVALELHRVRIASMLSQIQEQMLQSVGQNGMPWFNAMRDRWGCMWGGLEEADKLLAVGRAAGMVRTHTPRADCDVPYAVILDNEVRQVERNRPENKRNRSMLYWNFNYKQR